MVKAECGSLELQWITSKAAGSLQPRNVQRLVRSAAHLLNGEDVLRRLHHLSLNQADGAVAALHIDHAERIEQRHTRSLVYRQVVIGERDPDRPDLPQLPLAVVDQRLRQ